MKEAHGNKPRPFLATYAYHAITGAVTTGAGRLASVSVPIAGSTATVTYGYD